MKGKTVLITGTASGMGRIASRQLAAKGARLILVDFDVANGEQGRDEIMAETGNTDVEFIDCDVTSYTQVRNMTDHVKKNYSRLDVLINNAGITESVRRESVEGFEMTMATNFLGPFLISRLLLSRRTRDPRWLWSAARMSWRRNCRAAMCPSTRCRPAISSAPTCTGTCAGYGTWA
jgi:NAD(P)-dependent dehydrogenase (short-subunit alcohol dehydrogenase family)